MLLLSMLYFLSFQAVFCLSGWISGIEPRFAVSRCAVRRVEEGRPVLVHVSPAESDSGQLFSVY